MASPEFRRRLDAQSVELLRTHPVTRRILELVRAGDDLDLQLRGSFVDVYLGGFSVFQIDLRPARIRLGSATERNPRPHPWVTTWIPLDDLHPADLEAGIEWVKDQRADKSPFSERQFESNVVRDNRPPDSRMIVLDRQVVQPGWKMRLDLLLYDSDSERLVLTELKLMTNIEATGEVFEQLLRHQGLLANNPGIAATYPHVYEQKVALGLLPQDLPWLRADRPPLLLYLLGGYDRATAFPWMREQIRTAVRRKRKEFRSLQVRMRSIAEFQEPGSCRLGSIAGLPLFEDWAKAEDLT
jgi:hypothetical protein